MSSSPLVSIIIAVKNGALTLARALQSIVDQAFQDFEVIIIDDGSVDATPTLLQEWQKKIGPHRCHIIRTEYSRGQTAALNQGLARARGPYVARLDADDWWTPDKLQRQINWLSRHPEHGLVGSAWVNHAPTGTTIYRPPQADKQIRRRIWWRNPFAHSCIVVRRDLVQYVGGYEESIRHGQDLDLWFRLLPETKMANLPDILCQRMVTLSENKQRQQMRQTIQTLKKYAWAYKPSWWAYGGFIEPWLIVHADWQLPTLLLSFFFLLQLSYINYGTTLNDLPFIREASVSSAALAASEQQLQRRAIVSPEAEMADELRVEQGLLRFKLYSVDSDEMVNIMALARLKPTQLNFDPHFYMYGGAYLYPLGAFYAALVKVSILDEPTLPALLTNLDLVDRIYILGRLFVLVSVVASGFVLYRAARLFLPVVPAALVLLIFLATPMTITHSIVMKPHWWALLPTTIVLYYLIRLFEQRKWTIWSELLVGLGCGVAVGAATTYAPFIVAVWLATLYARSKQMVPTRTLVIIPSVAAAIFILTNPYVFLNYPAWQAEAAELAGWYTANLDWSAVTAFLKNSLIPGFGVAGIAALALAVFDLIGKHTLSRRLIAVAILTTVILAATTTASVSFWHTNTRLIPYAVPLMALYLSYCLPRRWLVVLTTLMILQALPQAVAFRDENNPAYSTRLRAAAWIEQHIQSREKVCARLVPYDTAPFDFTRYPAETDRCRYIVQVERERPRLLPEYTSLVNRFEPRFNRFPLPLVTNHINPQISIYENLAAY